MNIHAQVRLLEYLVQLWDPEEDVFNLQGETLQIIVEEIYFIIGLSHKGAPLSLSGTGRGGDLLSVQDYVNTYCLPGTQKSSTQIPISQVTSFPLKFIVSTITQVEGTYELHLGT